MVAFLLPFAFVYNPGLLLIGGWEAAMFDIAKVSVGVLVLAAATEGWYHGVLNRWIRVALIGTGLLSMSAWDIAGVVAVLVAGIYLMAKRFSPLIDQCFRADRDGRRACITMKKKTVEIKQ